MPSRKEKRQFVRTGALIGEADMLTRQRLTGNEHGSMITAALDTAAVQLLFLVTGDPVMTARGGTIDVSCQVTRSTALAGVQILGWKRLVGVKAHPELFEPLIDPFEYGALVNAGALMVDTFVEMTDHWYEMLKTSDTDDQNRHLDKFTRALWKCMERRVYGSEPVPLDPLDMVGVSVRLTGLQNQTHPYFLARVNGHPMPPTDPRSPLWYVEEFTLFESDRQ